MVILFNYRYEVGNKIDLPNREVTTREASEFARDNGCFYMETSALDGTGVNQAFYKGTCTKLPVLPVTKKWIWLRCVRLRVNRFSGDLRKNYSLIGSKSLENETIKSIYLVAIVSLFPLLVFLCTVLLFIDCIPRYYVQRIDRYFQFGTSEEVLFKFRFRGNCNYRGSLQ